MWPRFDEPRLTIPISNALEQSELSIPPQRPLPSLGLPDSLAIDANSVEPLTEISGQGIQVLGNYKLAGWPAAHPRCLARTSVARALLEAAARMPTGFGLAIFDAWRPLALQKQLHEASEEDPSIPAWLVAPPSEDPLSPPPHLTGGAIDVTLTIGGAPVELGTMFDDSTELAAANAFEPIPGPVRDGRRMLYWTMRSAGFIVFAEEWWHFERGTGRWAAITGRPGVHGAASCVHSDPEGPHA